MTRLKFILQSLSYFRKQHLAVVAGVLISTAVLTGAFITGESIRHTLTNLVEYRLGKTEYALQTGERFVRAALASDLQKELEVQVASAFLVNGVCSNPDKQKKINNASIVGIDSSFWKFMGADLENISDGNAVISKNTADKLEVETGDEVVLKVENKDVVPLRTPFGENETPYISLRLKITRVLPENSCGRFSLKSNQIAPYNIFISQEELSKALNIPGLTNTILVGGNRKIQIDELQSAVNKLLTPEDAGIEVKRKEETTGFQIQSSRIFIDEIVAKTIMQEFPEAKPAITYLVNSISNKEKATPYSFVSALPENMLSERITENQIIINQWLSDDLDVSPGDSLDLTYFVVDENSYLKEDTASFVVAEVIETDDSLADKSLMPHLPGIESSGNCRDWNTRLPIDLDVIRDKDEEYWDTYKGTPKAIITGRYGQAIWSNIFGTYTSIDIPSNENDISKRIMKNLEARDFGFFFRKVKEEGTAAAVNGVDFAELFGSLSFFVILGGILLTILVHKLNMDSRSKETGILLGTGFTSRQILSLRIRENMLTIVVGSALGVAVGVLWSMGTMAAINTIWNDIVRTESLSIHLSPIALAEGLLGGFLISFLAIYFSTRKHIKRTVTEILNTTRTYGGKIQTTKMAGLVIAVSGLIVSGLLIGYSLFSNVDQNASLFLVSGALILLSCYLIALNIISPSAKKRTRGILTLALRNAGQNRSRSMAVVVLLSLGTFVILLTSANRLTFQGKDNEKSSGTGGYTWWVETGIPMKDNISTPAGRSLLGIDEEMASESSFLCLQAIDGDDASCLNLNSVQNPQIIGVQTKILASRKSFSFTQHLNDKNSESPWEALDVPFDSGFIPAFADQSVITWGIKKKLGDTLLYADEYGNRLGLILTGGLENSVFQGKVLVSAELLAQHFPSSAGTKLFLVETTKPEALKEELEYKLEDYGVVVGGTSERLAAFYSVTNTYLSVFMLLGALGVLIGTAGMAIIIYRNMLDRRQELALYKALGFRENQILSLVFSEHFFLVFAGMFSGVLAATAAILPSLASESFSLPNGFVFSILLLIFVNAVFWVYFPARNAMKRNLKQSINQE